MDTDRFRDEVRGDEDVTQASSIVAPLRLLIVRTTGIAAEALQSLLDDWGALGSAIEQRRGTRLVRLQAYFPADADVPIDWVKAKLSELHANGVPVGPGDVRLEPLRREDWAESWKRYFHPIRVTDRLVVVPTWEDVPEGAREVIRIDPGMAFGLGDHPTTQGCLQMLERIAGTPRGAEGPLHDGGRGMRHGVLAIRAVQLGYGPVEGFDTEADAIRSARENAERNGVVGKIVFHEGIDAGAGRGSLPADSREHLPDGASGSDSADGSRARPARGR